MGLRFGVSRFYPISFTTFYVDYQGIRTAPYFAHRQKQHPEIEAHRPLPYEHQVELPPLGVQLSRLLAGELATAPRCRASRVEFRWHPRRRNRASSVPVMGRGPTKDISPRSTCQNCGISSNGVTAEEPCRRRWEPADRRRASIPDRRPVDALIDPSGRLRARLIVAPHGAAAVITQRSRSPAAPAHTAAVRNQRSALARRHRHYPARKGTSPEPGLRAARRRPGVRILPTICQVNRVFSPAAGRVGKDATVGT